MNHLIKEWRERLRIQDLIIGFAWPVNEHRRPFGIYNQRRQYFADEYLKRFLPGE